MREPLAGELNRFVQIFGIRHDPEGTAKLRKDPQRLAGVWGKVEVVGGVAYVEAMNIEETTTHRVFVRYVPGVTRPQDLKRVTELLIDGLFYRIRRVTDVNGRHRFTAFDVEELGECLPR